MKNPTKGVSRKWFISFNVNGDEYTEHMKITAKSCVRTGSFSIKADGIEIVMMNGEITDIDTINND